MGLLLATGALNKDEPSSPKPRDVFREGRQTLRGLKRLAPEQYALTEEYTRRYGDLYSDMLGEHRGRAYGDMTSMDPNQQALLGELQRQAMADLQMGGEMDPTEIRRVQQQIRSNRSSMGWGGASNDLLMEAVALTQSGRALQDRRRAFAGGVADRGLRHSELFMPLAENSARSTLAAGAAQGTFDPFNAYAQDVHDTNFNAKWSNKLSIRNYNAAVTGALIGAIGDIVGGAAGGAAGGV